MIGSYPSQAHQKTLPQDLHRGVPAAWELIEEWLEKAEIYQSHNHIPEAIDCYRRALALNPTLAEAHFNLGNLFLDQKRFSEAVHSFDRVLEIRPELAEAHFNRGIAMLDSGRLPEAESSFRYAAALKSDMTAAHYNLGVTLQRQLRLQEAAECFRRAVALDDGFADAWNNLGTTLLEMWNLRGTSDDCREATACFHKSLAHDPASAHACNNLGKLHQDRREITAAIAWYREALARQPEYALAHFNLSTAYLISGSYADGWRAYEWRFKRDDWQSFYPRRISLPRWDGRSFKGRTLWVHTEQGMGDTIQFIRYLPRVKALGGTVVFETHKTFMRLFSGLDGVDRIVEYCPSNSPEKEADLFVPLLSLPGIFGTELTSIPGTVPYLAADPSLVGQWKKRFTGEEMRIGLVWAGSGVNPRRSLPLAWFTPLTRIPGTRWYGLQKGAAGDQTAAEGLPKGMSLELIGREFEDFSDTAAALSCLDIIISIDTSVAHLSVALARPTYLLLDYASEWRWLLDREDSPWYPTMRLFRQERPGDWRAPLTRIGREIETLASNLAKALSVGRSAGIEAGYEFYRSRGRSVEAPIFLERLKTPAVSEALPAEPPSID
jgi:tetratricopeptide (TPR) repeat protein